MNYVPETRFFARLEEIPTQALALFGRDGVFSTLGWYRSTVATALPADSRAAFLEVARDGEPLALFPMQRGPAAAFSTLTTPYTCLWQPLFATSAPEELMEIGHHFAKACRGFPTTRLDALDADAAWLPHMLKGISAAGLYPLRFDHFGNWHEDVHGVHWEAYLAGRPGALREAIRRRGRRLMDKMGAVFSITTGGDDLGPAIATYESIYDQSWKEPEPFALFNAAFMREAAAEGCLRLGILSLQDKPLAAQFWLVQDGKAAVLKLAHDEASRALSPGTVLTGLMIRHMLENEHVSELDFGRGDDDYKKDWTRARRQRIGFLLADPRSIVGAGAILRHAAGAVRRRYLGGVSR
jgi:hypothetical protein